MNKKQATQIEIMYRILRQSTFFFKLSSIDIEIDGLWHGKVEQLPRGKQTGKENKETSTEISNIYL